MIRRAATEHGEIFLKSNGARLQRPMDRKPCCPGGLRARTNYVSRGVGCELPCSGDGGSLVVELCTLATGQQGVFRGVPIFGVSLGACTRFRAMARGYDVAVFGNNQQNCGELHSGAANHSQFLYSAADCSRRATPSRLHKGKENTVRGWL